LPIVKHVPSPHPERRAALSRIRETLIGLEAELNALDAKVGDGDTGSTFATAARAIDLDALPLADPSALCAALSASLAQTMGGSSGILLAIFTAAMGAKYTDLTSALRAGLRAVQHYGGAVPGDRTMLDAFVPALEVLEKGGSLEEAAGAAKKGAEATAAMKSARAGRSSYVRSDVLSGIPDPGAVAVARIFAALP
jgi:dihydroxyacetone kinase